MPTAAQHSRCGSEAPCMQHPPGAGPPWTLSICKLAQVAALFKLVVGHISPAAVCTCVQLAWTALERSMQTCPCHAPSLDFSEAPFQHASLKLTCAPAQIAGLQALTSNVKRPS